MWIVEFGGSNLLIVWGSDCEIVVIKNYSIETSDVNSDRVVVEFKWIFGKYFLLGISVDLIELS